MRLGAQQVETQTEKATGLLGLTRPPTRCLARASAGKKATGDRRLEWSNSDDERANEKDEDESDAGH